MQTSASRFEMLWLGSPFGPVALIAAFAWANGLTLVPKFQTVQLKGQGGRGDKEDIGSPVGFVFAPPVPLNNVW